MAATLPQSVQTLLDETKTAMPGEALLKATWAGVQARKAGLTRDTAPNPFPLPCQASLARAFFRGLDEGMECAAPLHAPRLRIIARKPDFRPFTTHAAMSAPQD